MAIFRTMTGDYVVRCYPQGKKIYLIADSLQEAVNKGIYAYSVAL